MTDTTKPSRLITFLGRAGLVFLLLMPISVFAVRIGLHFSIGLPMFAAAGLLSLIVIIMLVIVALLPRYRYQRNRALLWALPPLLPVAILASTLSTARQYPPIHDITTDTEDPPLFDSGVYYRGDEANSIDIKPDVIEMQKQHYPDLATITTELEEEEAFQHASDVAESLEWEIYNSDPANGLIEAQYTSAWFGFKDDIVIRIRPADVGSEVDLRSVSRVGVSDLGANATRIRAFVERY